MSDCQNQTSSFSERQALATRRPPAGGDNPVPSTKENTVSESIVRTAEQPRPAYQERVIQEKADLDEKIVKLEAYLTSTDDQRWSIGNALLYAQLPAMKSYSQILGLRIHYFDKVS